jgi:hypothetical protein
MSEIFYSCIAHDTNTLFTHRHSTTLHATAIPIPSHSSTFYYYYYYSYYTTTILIPLDIALVPDHALLAVDL